MPYLYTIADDNKCASFETNECDSNVKLMQSLITEIDECENEELNDCDPNALCTNTEGSYVCRCRGGYTGDGKICTGGGTFV